MEADRSDESVTPVRGDEQLRGEEDDLMPIVLFQRPAGREQPRYHIGGWPIDEPVEAIDAS